MFVRKQATSYRGQENSRKRVLRLIRLSMLGSEGGATCVETRSLALGCSRAGTPARPCPPGESACNSPRLRRLAAVKLIGGT